MVKPLYDIGPAIQQFRAIIRPSMFGNIGVIEPIIAGKAAKVLYEWLIDTVEAAVRSSGINSRTGNLRRELLHGVRVTGRSSLRTMHGRVWTQPWVFPHEYGATIEAKTSPWLAIPFAYGVHPDGRPKFRSPSAWRRYKSFIITHKDGRKFIVYKSGGQLKYLYVLVDSVDIPARLGLNKMGDLRIGSLLGELGQIYINEMFARGLNLKTMEGVRK